MIEVVPAFSRPTA